MVSKSLLQLERCLVTSLIIKTRECLSIESGIEITENLDLQFAVRRHKTEPKFLIPLTLTVTWPQDALSYYEKIELSLDSIFALPPGTSEDELRQYVPVLCLSNLLGIARGLIVQSTSLCPGGAYMLSLVNMQELLITHTKHQQEQSEGTTPLAESVEQLPVKPARRKRRNSDKETA